MIARFFFPAIVSILLVGVSLRIPPTHPLMIINWGMMVLVGSLSYIGKPSYFKTIFLLLFGGYFVLHNSFTDDTVISSLMYFTGAFLMINLDNDKFITSRVFFAIVIYALINLIWNFEELVMAIRSMNIEKGFLGFTQNTNTNSTIGILFFISSWYLIRLSKNKIYLILLFFSIFYVLACFSRNSILYVLIVVSLIFLWQIVRKNYDLYAVAFTLLILVACSVYMTIGFINSDMDLFGKGASSSSRTFMILYAVENFDITYWGSGRSFVGSIISDEFEVGLHNGYLNTLYSYGMMYLLFYCTFLIFFYRNLNYAQSKAFLLGVHVYYFYEPTIFFESGLTSLVLLMTIMTGDRLLSQQKIKSYFTS